MSVWLEIPRRHLDGKHKASSRATVRSTFQILQKFFPELSRVRTVLPCRPDSRTLVAHNFHIKASRVWTIGSVVRTVDLMYAIFIYEARTSVPWGIASGCLDFECTTCLMDERVRMGSTSSGRLQLSSYICVLERNPIAVRILSGVRTCCWNIRTDASWNSSKLLDTGEGPDGKFLLSRRMMLGQLSIRTENHVVRTAARDPISLTCRLCRIF